MHVELLSRIPLSGTLRERHYHASAKENAWVRFDDGAGDEWVGVFGAGDRSPYTAVVPFADDAGRTVLVIAGGQGYVVDAPSGQLLRRTAWDYSYAAAPAPGREFVIVADTTCIWAVHRMNDATAVSAVRHAYDNWTGQDYEGQPTRVALDGIVFDAPGPEALTGAAWQMDGWYGFRLCYDGLTVEPGPLVAVEGDAMTADAARGGYPVSDEAIAIHEGHLL